MKNELKNAEVFGTDISENALVVARQNAIKNNLDVDFFQADILKWEKIDWKTFDVIVSNPPYIRESEKKLIHPNVINHEPASALFVADSNPLVFYRSIAIFAKKQLSGNGLLFFEINENLGSEMKKMLICFGFSEIEIRKDINRKNRMVCCRNSTQ